MEYHRDVSSSTLTLNGSRRPPDAILDDWKNYLRKVFNKSRRQPRFVEIMEEYPESTMSSIPMSGMNRPSDPIRRAPGVPSSMFGRPLKDSLDETTGVSRFVLWCVEAIATTGDGLDTDAIYRTSGTQGQVQNIAKQSEKNMREALEEEDNVNVLTGALKLFFKQLVTPVIDFEDFNRAIQTESPIEDIRLLVFGLPAAERNTLSFLMSHLEDVLDHHAVNNMSIPGLAGVFGPTLMRLATNPQDMAADMKQQNRIVEFLLSEYDTIFPRDGRRDGLTTLDVHQQLHSSSSDSDTKTKKRVSVDVDKPGTNSQTHNGDQYHHHSNSSDIETNVRVPVDIHRPGTNTKHQIGDQFDQHRHSNSNDNYTKDIPKALAVIKIPVTNNQKEIVKQSHSSSSDSDTDIKKKDPVDNTRPGTITYNTESSSDDDTRVQVRPKSQSRPVVDGEYTQSISVRDQLESNGQDAVVKYETNVNHVSQQKRYSPADGSYYEDVNTITTVAAKDKKQKNFFSAGLSNFMEDTKKKFGKAKQQESQASVKNISQIYALDTNYQDIQSSSTNIQGTSEVIVKKLDVYATVQKKSERIVQPVAIPPKPPLTAPPKLPPTALPTLPPSAPPKLPSTAPPKLPSTAPPKLPTTAPPIYKTDPLYTLDTYDNRLSQLKKSTEELDITHLEQHHVYDEDVYRSYKSINQKTETYQQRDQVITSLSGTAITNMNHLHSHQTGGSISKHQHTVVGPTENTTTRIITNRRQPESDSDSSSSSDQDSGSDMEPEVLYTSLRHIPTAL